MNSVRFLYSLQVQSAGLYPSRHKKEESKRPLPQMDDKAQVRNVCRGETDLMNHLTAHIQQNQGVQHGQDCQQILQHEVNSQKILLNK